MHDASPSVLRFPFSARNVRMNLSAMSGISCSNPILEPVSGITLDADGIHDLAVVILRGGGVRGQACRENGFRNLTLSIPLVCFVLSLALIVVRIAF